MDELERSLFLAFVGFVLGLLGGQIERILNRQRRVLEWDIDSRPIIAVDRTLPPEILADLPSAEMTNITRFELSARPVGKAMSGAEALIVPRGGGRLLKNDVVTEPVRGIQYELVKDEPSQELRLNIATLRLDQAVKVVLFLQSKEEPSIDVYWSGVQEDLKFQRVSFGRDKGLEEHLRSIALNLILAFVIPAILSATAAIISVGLYDELYATGASGVARFTGTLLSGYFLLRTLPHAVAITRIYGSRRPPSVEVNARDNSLVAIGEGAHISGNRRGHTSDPEPGSEPPPAATEDPPADLGGARTAG